MKFHDFSPFYRSGEGSRSKVSGDRLIDNPAVADAQGGSDASYSFDGTDDYVGIGHDDNLKPTHSITVSAWANAVDWTDTTSRRIFSNTQNGGAAITLNGGGGVPSGNVGAMVNITTTGYISAYTPTSGLGAGWHHFVGIYDGRYVKFYVDGVLVSTTDSLHDNRTIAQHASNSTFIGAEADAGATPAGYYFDGEISQVRLHNRALSAAEVRASYNGQAVGFEYVGAKQDSLVSAWTNEIYGDWGFDTVSGSSATGFTAINAAASGSYGMIHSLIADTPGKNYRISFTATLTSGTAPAVRVASNNPMSANLTVNQTIVAGSNVIEYTSASTDAYIGFRSEENVATNFTIADFTVHPIGCVAEFLPSGINATQWVDTSGNNLHGTTSTATAVNHTTGALTTVGDIRIGSGSGISFSPYDDAVTTPGSDSNLLDDYEEGTWTAGFTGTTSSAVSNTTGYYVKIGRAVHFSYYSGSVTFASSSGDAIISGLPFVSTSDSYAAGLFWYVHGNAVDGISTGGHVVSGNNTMYFIEQNAVSAPTYVDGSSKYMKIVGTYYV